MLRKQHKNGRRIILYVARPPWRAIEEYEQHRDGLPLPLSVLFLAGAIQNMGVDVSVIDGLVEKDPVTRIKELLPDAMALGVSVMGPYSATEISDSAEISRLAKEHFPNVVIIWGGGYPTLYPTNVLKRHAYIDYLVRGPGEIPLRKLIRNILAGKESVDAPGVCYRKGEKIFIREIPKRHHRQALFPNVPYELIDIEKYAWRKKRRYSLEYITTRGCPRGCHFCAVAAVYHSRQYKARLPRVIRDLKYLKGRYPGSELVFADENFFGDYSYAKKIIEGLIEEDIGMPWIASARADDIANMEEEDIRLLKRSGCKILQVGVESGSDRSLRLVKKGISQRDILTCTSKLARAGIAMFAYIMINLPEEKLQDTLKLMRTIKNIMPESEFLLHRLKILPETKLHRALGRNEAAATIRDKDTGYQKSFRIAKIYKFYLHYAFWKPRHRLGLLKFLMGHVMQRISALRIRTNCLVMPLEYYAIKWMKKVLDKIEMISKMGFEMQG